MKCALELLTMKAEAEKQYEIKQITLDEECRINHMIIIEKTFDFCETVIGPALEKCALNRKTPIFTLMGGFEKDRVGNLIFYPLVRDGKYYADGTPSEKLNMANPYDVFTIKNYLENYCFNVSWKEMWYRRYNCGYQKGVKLFITI